MSVALNPRRWFRFRLRTVLLLVALLAIPFAWLGSEWKLVRRRLSMIDRVEAAGGMVTADLDVSKWLVPRVSVPWSEFTCVVRIKPGHEPIPISAVRRWLGDWKVNSIALPLDFPDNDEKQILDLFPDADVARLVRIPHDQETPAAITR